MLRFVALLLLATFCAGAEEIPLPRRPAGALSGAEFAAKVASFDLLRREAEITAEILAGNVPEFWRRFIKVEIQRERNAHADVLNFWVAPDYLAIGSDTDFLLVPVTPHTGQAIADRLGCMLPTRQMVDDIYQAAKVKLAPAPIDPSPAMTTMVAFFAHHGNVSSQRASFIASHGLGALVAGHKKDVVITNRLEPDSLKVAIYGWHRPDGTAIQPLYTGHTAQWVDYSHGVRLVRRAILLNGRPTTADAILADKNLAHLLSDEGVLNSTKYGRGRRIENGSSKWSERVEELQLGDGVRVVINSPSAPEAGRPARLILYALPNGSTIEQTMGRHADSEADWRYEIQHIAAQTRWLRSTLPGMNMIVAYLECAERSWPAWRRKHDPAGRKIEGIVEQIIGRLATHEVKVTLTGHSGGGSFTFGYINSVERIPEFIERIAFLDSNYAYNPAQGHAVKIARWLADDSKRFLCVLAYHDAIARLDGKPFVSSDGGTWGRSHAMLADFAPYFTFTASDHLDLRRRGALEGRIQFLLRENPTRAIFHTRLVELNGFIHAILCGTGQEERGYEYLGPRAYSDWISPR
jgi:hypothetical protein